MEVSIKSERTFTLVLSENEYDLLRFALIKVRTGEKAYSSDVLRKLDQLFAQMPDPNPQERNDK